MRACRSVPVVVAMGCGRSSVVLHGSQFTESGMESGGVNTGSNSYIIIMSPLMIHTLTDRSIQGFCHDRHFALLSCISLSGGWGREFRSSTM